VVRNPWICASVFTLFPIGQSCGDLAPAGSSRLKKRFRKRGAAIRFSSESCGHARGRHRSATYRKLIEEAYDHWKQRVAGGYVPPFLAKPE
jgi:hypothetical protein